MLPVGRSLSRSTSNHWSFRWLHLPVFSPPPLLPHWFHSPAPVTWTLAVASRGLPASALAPIEGPQVGPCPSSAQNLPGCPLTQRKGPRPHHSPQGPVPSARVIFVLISSCPSPRLLHFRRLAFLLFQECPSMFPPQGLCTCQFPGLGMFLSQIPCPSHSSTPSGRSWLRCHLFNEGSLIKPFKAAFQPQHTHPALDTRVPHVHPPSGCLMLRALSPPDTVSLPSALRARCSIPAPRAAPGTRQALHKYLLNSLGRPAWSLEQANTMGTKGGDFSLERDQSNARPTGF